MTAPKPAPASRVALDPAALTDRDPVGLPMVDERGQSHVRRFTLGSLERGPRHGEIGIEAAILGAIAADEIEDVCAGLLAMRDAAYAAQRQEAADNERAREVHALALRHSAADLRAALEAGVEIDGHDHELIADALELRADYAAAGVRLGGGT